MPYKRLLGPAVAAALTFLALSGPVAAPSLLLWERGDLTHSDKAADEHSASPLDFVIPNALHPLWGEPFMRAHSQQNVIEDLLYLGTAAIAITAAGFLLSRRQRPAPAGGSMPPRKATRGRAPSVPARLSIARMRPARRETSWMPRSGTPSSPATRRNSSHTSASVAHAGGTRIRSGSSAAIAAGSTPAPRTSAPAAGSAAGAPGRVTAGRLRTPSG